MNMDTPSRRPVVKPPLRPYSPLFCPILPRQRPEYVDQDLNEATIYTRSFGYSEDQISAGLGR